MAHKTYTNEDFDLKEDNIINDILIAVLNKHGGLSIEDFAEVCNGKYTKSSIKMAYMTIEDELYNVVTINKYGYSLANLSKVNKVKQLTAYLNNGGYENPVIDIEEDEPLPAVNQTFNIGHVGDRYSAGRDLYKAGKDLHTSTSKAKDSGLTKAQKIFAILGSLVVIISFVLGLSKCNASDNKKEINQSTKDSTYGNAK